MKAITLDGFGGPERMSWAEVPEPVLRDGELLIDVVASAVNRADVMQREGHYPPPAGASEILGLECTGRVAAIGAHVRGWEVGADVCMLLAGGGYAERVCAPAGQCMPIPAGIDLVSAAALPEVACTVHANLVMKAALKQGETLLVHGGGSGIGTFAIQYAVALGARVAVTAGSAEKLARCKELGAEILVNYRSEDFVEAVGQADVVLDNMGAKYLARNVSVLAPDGRIIVIGLQGGTKAELDIGALLRKRGTLFATSLRSRPVAQKAAVCCDVVEKVWPLVGSGKIKPVIDRVLPMSEAAAAHRLLEQSAHVGKILLTTGIERVTI